MRNRKYWLYEPKNISGRLTVVTFHLVTGCSKMLCAKPFSYWLPCSDSSPIFLLKHQQGRRRLWAKCILSQCVHATARQPVICCPMPCGKKNIAKLDILQQYILSLRLLHAPQEARRFFSFPGSRERTHITGPVWEFELPPGPCWRRRPGQN